MICIETAKRYCREDISRIRNYQEAMLDDSQTWECHHWNEQWWLSEELRKLGRYYNVPASELVFLPVKEHVTWHQKYGPASKSWKSSIVGFSERCEKSKLNPSYHTKLMDGIKKRNSNPEYAQKLKSAMEASKEFRLARLREYFHKKKMERLNKEQTND